LFRWSVSLSLLAEEAQVIRDRLLERAYEQGFWLRFSALVLGGLGAFALFVYLATGRDLGGSYGEAIYTIYHLKINIFSLVLASVYSVVIFVLTIVFIALVSIFFSHRMAGPLYRFVRELERLGRGEMRGRTTFRGRDQFVVLAEEKNRMTGALRGLARDVEGDFQEVKKVSEEILETLGTSGDGPLPEGLLHVLRQRLGVLDRLVLRTESRLRGVRTSNR